MSEPAKYIFSLIGVILVSVVIIFGVNFLKDKEQPERQALRELAQCISNKNITFYGAFWCPACASQKASFGNKSISKYLPYFECSNSDRTQKEACNDKFISNYPTWVNEDKDLRCGGIITPEILSAFADCSYHDLTQRGTDIFNKIAENTKVSLSSQNFTTEEIAETIAKLETGFNGRLQEKFSKDIKDTTASEMYELILESACVKETEFLATQTVLKSQREDAQNLKTLADLSEDERNQTSGSTGSSQERQQQGKEEQ